eukprot:GHVP01051393.1.p1 GENE.GHVP01051393.1~~GHVP01051393.1.p1  ORF type:complete len:849 (+),score=158.85 GHVP01051393.1:1265-3811(+)
MPSLKDSSMKQKKKALTTKTRIYKSLSERPTSMTHSANVPPQFDEILGKINSENNGRERCQISPALDNESEIFLSFLQSIRHDTKNEILKLIRLFNQRILTSYQLRKLIYPIFPDDGLVSERFYSLCKKKEANVEADVYLKHSMERISKNSAYYFIESEGFLNWSKGQHVKENLEITRELNFKYISIPRGSEDASESSFYVKNSYQESLFKLEDERYEFQLTIFRGRSFLKWINRQLSRDHDMTSPIEIPSIHKATLHLIYGSYLSEVQKQIESKPNVALRVVLARLKQRIAEWEDAKDTMQKGPWFDSVCNSFYKSHDQMGAVQKAQDKLLHCSANYSFELTIFTFMYTNHEKPTKEMSMKILDNSPLKNMEKLPVLIGNFKASTTDKRTLMKINFGSKKILELAVNLLVDYVKARTTVSVKSSSVQTSEDSTIVEMIENILKRYLLHGFFQRDSSKSSWVDIESRIKNKDISDLDFFSVLQPSVSFKKNLRRQMNLNLSVFLFKDISDKYFDKLVYYSSLIRPSRSFTIDPITVFSRMIWFWDIPSCGYSRHPSSNQICRNWINLGNEGLENNLPFLKSDEEDVEMEFLTYAHSIEELVDDPKHGELTLLVTEEAYIIFRFLSAITQKLELAEIEDKQRSEIHKFDSSPFPNSCSIPWDLSDDPCTRPTLEDLTKIASIDCRSRTAEFFESTIRVSLGNAGTPEVMSLPVVLSNAMKFLWTFPNDHIEAKLCALFVAYKNPLVKMSNHLENEYAYLAKKIASPKELYSLRWNPCNNILCLDIKLVVRVEKVQSEQVLPISYEIEFSKAEEMDTEILEISVPPNFYTSIALRFVFPNCIIKKLQGTN